MTTYHIRISSSPFIALLFDDADDQVKSRRQINRREEKNHKIMELIEICEKI